MNRPTLPDRRDPPWLGVNGVSFERKRITRVIRDEPDEYSYVNTYQFNGSYSLAEFMLNCPDPTGEIRDTKRNDWAGEHSNADVLNILSKGGDAKLAQQVSVVAGKIDLPPITAQAITSSTDVCGGPPLVPAYLSNAPDMSLTCSITQQRTDAIRIAACLVGSCGFEAEHLQRRALACCAVAQIVCRFRPVILEAYVALDAHYGQEAIVYKWPIATNPLSLAEAGVCFGAQALTRGVCFSHAEVHHNYRGQWPWSRRHGTNEPQGTTDAYDGGPEDLVIGGMISTDELSDDPAAWVAKQVERLTTNLAQAS